MAIEVLLIETNAGDEYEIRRSSKVIPCRGHKS